MSVRSMAQRKNIALVAHDQCKPAMLAWVHQHQHVLRLHTLYATRATGQMLRAAMAVEIHTFRSGPMGGDQQLGALIAEGAIDMLVFFWDPLSTLAHQSDVKALLRVATVWNIPIASNRCTADFLISSPLLHQPLHLTVPED